MWNPRPNIFQRNHCGDHWAGIEWSSVPSRAESWAPGGRGVVARETSTSRDQALLRAAPYLSFSTWTAGRHRQTWGEWTDLTVVEGWGVGKVKWESGNSEGFLAMGGNRWQAKRCELMSGWKVSAEQTSDVCKGWRRWPGLVNRRGVGRGRSCTLRCLEMTR